MSYSQKDRRIAVNTPLGEDVLLLNSFAGSEAISQLFSFDLEMYSENDAVAFDALIGKPATVGIALVDGSSRYFNGIIRAIEQGGRDHHLTTYRAQMAPWLWFLTQTSDHRIFQEKTAPEIIQFLFDEAKFRDYSLRLSGAFSKREYCVQYGETDFEFVSRLMESEGIYYYFEHEDGKHTMVLANHSGAHKPCPNQSKVRYDTDGGGLRDEDTIQQWRASTSVLTGGYALQDYNFETPSTSLQTNIGGRNLYERFEYPGGYLKRGEGESLVKTRLEEVEAPRQVVRGLSTCRNFSTGFRFDLKDHYRGDQNKSYLLTRVSHKASQGGDFRSGPDDDSFAYTNEFECMPFSNPYRPARVTPRPVISSTQTAVVVGKPGEEIWTDKYGRIKVQFHWDRYSKTDDTSSCWIRVSQAAAGKNWGAISLPRVGQEVVVSFLDGDPDRPLITGCVYNAEQMPPYDLPGEQTKSTFKSNSSKGGGGFNEIRFEDAKGKEQVFIHAERNEDIRVKKDLMETVEENSHRIVIKDHQEEVRGDKHLAVKGDQNEKIGGTVSLKAGMDYQAKVGKSYALDAGMEIHAKAGVNLVIESGVSLTIKVGGSFINLNPAGVFISGPMVMINSGGASGSGSGASPEPPKTPLEAMKAVAGAMLKPKSPKPPKPAVYSPAAIVLQRAAKSGTPFCEICARAAAQRNAS
jgi:type VI secretion system secreted protein VgrG